jgi:hypothetical protein
MSDNDRKLRSGGTTSAVSLDKNKKYKLNTAGSLVETTTEADTDIIFSGSKSSLRRLSDLERNVSILAARTQTEDGSGSGDGEGTVDKAERWASSRTITLGGDLSGSVSIRGDSDVTLNATIASNSIVLGTDTTGNYVATVSAGTGISVSGSGSESAGVTITNSLSASGGTIGGALAVSGGITATGEITAYYSDERLKTNVSKIDSALAKVMAINGYTYDSSELAESLGLPKHMDQIGLLANEVEAVLPELVTQSGIAGYKTIRYDKVVSVLVNAIKEQQAMIEELRKDMKKTLH